jgi:hypothetical protein
MCDRCECCFLTHYHFTYRFVCPTFRSARNPWVTNDHFYSAPPSLRNKVVPHVELAQITCYAHRTPRLRSHFGSFACSINLFPTVYAYSSMAHSQLGHLLCLLPALKSGCRHILVAWRESGVCVLRHATETCALEARVGPELQSRSITNGVFHSASLGGRKFAVGSELLRSYFVSNGSRALPMLRHGSWMVYDTPL